MGDTRRRRRSIIEQWVADGHTAFSNILPIDDPPFVYTPSIKKFLRAIANLKEPTRWLFILDEGSFVYSKPDQVTRRVKDLDKLMRIVGKMFGNMILVEHLPEAVPNVIQEFATSYYYCHKPGILTIHLKGPNLIFRTRICKFPLTSLSFETRDWAYFKTSGVNLQALYTEVSGAKNRRAAIGKFLDKVDKPLLKKRGPHPKNCRCRKCLTKDLEGKTP